MQAALLRVTATLEESRHLQRNNAVILVDIPHDGQVSMTPERCRQIEELYHAAREREPEEREALLAQACQSDVELRHEIESLLAQGSLAGVMEQPRLEVVAQLLGGDST